MRRHIPVVLLLILAPAVWLSAQRSPATPGSAKPDPLFATSRIVPVQLQFSAADYKALAPKSGGGWFGGGGGGSSQSWLQGPEGKRNGFAASRGVQFEYVHGHATIDGQT